MRRRIVDRMSEKEAAGARPFPVRHTRQLQLLVDYGASFPLCPSGQVRSHFGALWWTSFAKHQSTHLKMTTVCLLVGPPSDFK